MTFQSTVRIDQTTGIVGEILFDGPQRAESKILNSVDAANNVIGRAFSQSATVDGEVAAGGSEPFAGILANPLEYATSGTAAGGSLAPTITLPNWTQASLVTMGTMIVNMSTSAAIGDDVHYVDATGVLLAVAPGTAPAVGNSLVPNCRVVRQAIAAPGLAIVQLTN